MYSIIRFAKFVVIKNNFLLLQILIFMNSVYQAPEIEVIDVKIEKGFAQSDPLEDIIKKEPIGW